tara:strand:+ start:795 stop:1640 length:846 start_codon:yes stop_codon:yes gene_type:complete
MSFGWTVLFREGSWIEFRHFVLNQRKNAQSRIDTIDNELKKIGKITVIYEREDEEDDFSKLTEKRLGLATRTGTSIGKLLRAYTARGGNYFDISMFLIPDSYEIIDDNNRIEYMPFTGVLSPKSGDVQTDNIDETGLYDLWKDPPRKLGDKKSIWDHQDVRYTGDRVLAMRSWVNQEIKELRNNIEARILKLCDLREQLLHEKNELIMGSIAGTFGDTDFDPEAFLSDLHTSKITYLFDSMIFETDFDGKPDFTKPRLYDERALKTLLQDAPTGEEKHTAL